MKRIAHIAALKTYRLLPDVLQRFASRSLTTTYGLASKVMVTEPGGKILLVKQTYRNGWDLPGGFVNRQETPDSAALRELREETGLTGISLTQRSVIVEPDFRMVQILFTGQTDKELAPTADGVEISEIRWAHMNEATLTPAAAEAVAVLNDLKVAYHISSHKYYK